MNIEKLGAYGEKTEADFDRDWSECIQTQERMNEIIRIEMTYSFPRYVATKEEPDNGESLYEYIYALSASMLSKSTQRIKSMGQSLDESVRGLNLALDRVHESKGHC